MFRFILVKVLFFCIIFFISNCNSSVAFSSVVPGAKLNYTEIEAENMVVASGVTVLSAPSYPNTPSGKVQDTVPVEASNKQCVQLKSTSDSISYTADRKYNTIVIRYCVPIDATDSKINVEVDGKNWATLRASNKFCYIEGWTYNEKTPQEYPKPKVIDKNTHHFFDEARAKGADILPGQTIKISGDLCDSNNWYIIDLINLEYVDTKYTLGSTTFFTMPDDFISISKYKTDNKLIDKDWANIINKCITEVKDGKYTGIWIPAGEYELDAKIEVSGIKIYGEGMWHTNLIRTTVKNYEVFTCIGGDNEFKNFAILGSTVNRDDPKQDNAFGGNPGENTILDSLWIEHTKCGFWVIAGDKLTIKNCRIRNLYADGVNFCGGTTNSLIYNCNFRNTGDDSIAAWSSTAQGKKEIDANNTFDQNTVQVPWRASCIALYGGDRNLVTNNYCHDSCVYPGINIAQNFDPHPFVGTTVIDNNKLEGCGGNWQGEWQSSINISPWQNPIKNLQFTNNTIIAPVYVGIYFSGFYNKNIINATFENTNFQEPGSSHCQVLVRSYAYGEATFTNSNLTKSDIKNNSANFEINRITN